MTRPDSVEVFAPAKINLSLHVTGQKPDGYHLIDSLVAFADVGDTLRIHTGNTVSLTLEGPEADAVPADSDNLIMKVAGLFEELHGASFLLTKYLPVSSGVGGGSADAAAAFRGLLRFLGKKNEEMTAETLAPMGGRLLAMGADIPMCLLSACARVQGIGEQITPIDSLPQLDAILVNPRHAVSTPAVFKALRHRENPAMPDRYTSFKGVGDFISWLAEQRNDLEEPALRLEPAIAQVTAALRSDPSCRLARMSGSGATCFGLYETRDDAESAARAVAKAYPDWWVRPARLGTQTPQALPRVS